MTVAEALPKVAKLLLASHDEMKEKKQELDLSVLEASNGFVHRVLPRDQVEQLTDAAKRELDNDM